MALEGLLSPVGIVPVPAAIFVPPGGQDIQTDPTGTAAGNPSASTPATVTLTGSISGDPTSSAMNSGDLIPAVPTDQQFIITSCNITLNQVETTNLVSTPGGAVLATRNSTGAMAGAPFTISSGFRFHLIIPLQAGSNSVTLTWNIQGYYQQTSGGTPIQFSQILPLPIG